MLFSIDSSTPPPCFLAKARTGAPLGMILGVVLGMFAKTGPQFPINGGILMIVLTRLNR
jgi:hypothetical protein